MLTTLQPRAAADIADALRTWRYAPYKANGMFLVEPGALPVQLHKLRGRRNRVAVDGAGELADAGGQDAPLVGVDHPHPFNAMREVLRNFWLETHEAVFCRENLHSQKRTYRRSALADVASSPDGDIGNPEASATFGSRGKK